MRDDTVHDLTRRNLLAAGLGLSAAALLAGCGGAAARRWPIEGAPPADEPPIVAALRYGACAPSAHNTQPWRFELQSDTEALLFVDRERLLPSTDPLGRQIHMSHGTLLELVALAAPSLGHRAELSLFPDGDMTVAEYGQRPTARIRLLADAGAPPSELLRQVPSRRTSRLPYEPTPLSDEEVGQLVDAVDDRVAAARVVTGAALDEVRAVMVEAMTAEVDDHALYDESKRWFRFSAKDVRRHRDGLDLAMVGVTSLGAKLFLTDRNWHTPANRRRYLSRFAETVAATPGALVLTTRTNEHTDWIGAGRQYLRAQLRAGALGLRLHPTSQALQELPQMTALERRLESLFDVPAGGKIQMLARVGRSATPAQSPRRALEQLVAGPAR